MPRIKLIVTGEMEKLALHNSLQGFFPNQHDGEQVIWEKPRKADCVTTNPLLPLNHSNPSMAMKRLAEYMLDEALVGGTKGPADLVVVIDDVEIANLGQEHLIAEHFRAAIEYVLENKKYSSSTEDRYREILRNKCSFHVLKPMVESYLFGDSNALRVAGVPAGKSPKLVHPTDVEQFETNDPAWLPTCRVENAKRQPWWHHECHPKHYLEYLTEYEYEETKKGKDALTVLKWIQVPKYPSDIPLGRSLFEDIADWFGIPNPLGQGTTDQHFYPPKSVKRANLLLRNM
jgi:hypothetical protein